MLFLRPQASKNRAQIHSTQSKVLHFGTLLGPQGGRLLPSFCILKSKHLLGSTSPPIQDPLGIPQSLDSSVNHCAQKPSSNTECTLPIKSTPIQFHEILKGKIFRFVLQEIKDFNNRPHHDKILSGSPLVAATPWFGDPQVLAQVQPCKPTRAPRNSQGPQVDIDTFKIGGGLRTWQLHVEWRDANSPGDVHAQEISIKSPIELKVELQVTTQTRPETLEAPGLPVIHPQALTLKYPLKMWNRATQYLSPATDPLQNSGNWCSPTTVGLLAQSTLPPQTLASMLYHPQLSMYGVWPQALWLAHILGRPMHLSYCSEAQIAEEWLRQGPIGISIRVKPGFLRGFPLPQGTKGHLLVLWHIENGWAWVVDPAHTEGAIQAYTWRELWECWSSHGGLSYVPQSRKMI